MAPLSSSSLAHGRLRSTSVLVTRALCALLTFLFPFSAMDRSGAVTLSFRPLLMPIRLARDEVVARARTARTNTFPTHETTRLLLGP